MIRLLSFHKVCFPKLNHVITSWLPRPGCTEGEITPGGQYGKKLWRSAHSIAIYPMQTDINRDINVSSQRELKGS